MPLTTAKQNAKAHDDYQKYLAALVLDTLFAQADGENPKDYGTISNEFRASTILAMIKDPKYYAQVKRWRKKHFG